MLMIRAPVVFLKPVLRSGPHIDPPARQHGLLAVSCPGAAPTC